MDAPGITHRWALIVAVCVAVLAGCEPAKPTSTTAPADDPQPAMRPLPPQARLKLDELKPAIPKPVNPPDAYKVPDRAAKLVADAVRKIAARQYAAAVNDLERAVGYEPTNARIRQLLGFAYAGLRDRGRAEDNLAKAVKSAPDDLKAHLLLGELAVSAKQEDRAILSLRTALRCTGAEPNEPLAAEAMLRLGEMLEKAGYHTAAVECYATLSQWVEQHGQQYASRATLRNIVLRPEQLLVRRGAVLLHLRRAKEAVEFLRRAHSRDRTDLLTVQLLVRCLVQMRDYPEAEKVLAGMTSEPLLRQQLPALIEEAARASGDKHMVGRIWQAAPKKVRTDQVWALSLSQSAKRLGAAADAVDILKSLFQAMPEDAGIARELAELSAEIGKPDQALTILVKSLAANQAAEPAVVQGLRELLASLPAGAETKLARDASRQQADQQFAYHYVAGRVAHMRGNLDLAAEQYRKAAERKRSFLPAHEALLEIYLQREQYAQADKQIQSIEKLNVGPHFIAYARGKLELAKGDVAAAIVALEGAYKENDEHLPTVLLLAEAYQRVGREGDASLALQAALKLPGDKTQVYRRLLPLLLKRRLFRQAQVIVAEARKERPDSLETALMAAQLLVAAGQREQAARSLAELTKRAPRNVDVRLLGLRLELGTGQGILAKSKLEQAARKLNDLMQQDPQNTSARRLLAELYLQSARYEDAATQWKPLYDANPRQGDLARQYVRALILADRYADARDVLERMLSFSQDDLAARQTLLEVLQKLKQFDRAAELAEGWLKQASKDQYRFLYRLRLMSLYEAAEQYDKSLKLLDDWISSPGNETLLPSLKGDKIRLLTRAKRYDQAVEFARSWIKAEPLDNTPRQVLIATLSQAKQYDLAVKLLDEWIAELADEKAEDWKAFKLLILAEAERIDKAKAFGSRWIREQPGSLRARTALVSALIHAEKHDEVLRLIDKWLGEMPGAATKPARPSPASQPAGQIQLRRVVPVPGDEAPDELPEFAPPRALPPALQAEPQSRRARPDTQAATAPAATQAAEVPPTTTPTQPAGLDPNAVGLLRETAVQVLMLKPDYAEALRRTEQYLKLDPNNLALVSFRASCLTELGKAKQALDDLRRVQQLRPLEPGPMNNLGYQYAELGIELTKAEELIRQAVTVRPETAFIDSLGWVLYKQGRLGQAAAAFEEILRQQRDDDAKPLPAIIFDHAGDAFWRLGWNDKAVTLWKRSLEVAKDEKPVNHEVTQVQAHTPGKIEAVEAGRQPDVAPLGEGVKEPDTD